VKHTEKRIGTKIAGLIPDAKNANRHSERGQAVVAESLAKYGAGRSILIDKHGRIIAGNLTVEQAGAAGLTDLIVVQSDGTKLVAVQRTDLDLLKDDRAKLLAIADNRSAEVSLVWDAELLASLAETVDMSGLFSNAEILKLLGGRKLLTDPDAVPAKPKRAKSKRGDLYLLGDHRLLCGDSTVATDLEALMGGRLGACVWTDPPYNIGYVGKTKDALTIQNDSMGSGEFRTFLSGVFALLLGAVEDGASIYIAHADTEGYNFRGAMVDAGWSFRQCLIWAKNCLVMGRSDYHWMHEPILLGEKPVGVDVSGRALPRPVELVDEPVVDGVSYRPMHEPLLYGWKPGAAHNWYADRRQTTLLEFDRPNASKEHPTMKPVALVEYCIENSCRPGGIVVDLFGGSGTTLLACEKSGRSAYLLELDPVYCDVIVKRWEDATGRKAVLHGYEEGGKQGPVGKARTKAERTGKSTGASGKNRGRSGGGRQGDAVPAGGKRKPGRPTKA
jgi:DNA modification methylase